MSNYLGEFLKARREALGLDRGEVVRRLGYRNVNRGCRRLCGVEAGRGVDRATLRRLVAVLRVEPAAVRQVIDRDCREYVAAWERWADEPVPLRVFVLYPSGVMGTVDPPAAAATPDRAVAWAAWAARSLGRIVVVAVSRRTTYLARPDGRGDGPLTATPFNTVPPYLGLGHRRFLLGLRDIGPVEPASVPPEGE